VARTPQFLTLKQHRDRAERRYVPWRRGAMVVVAAIVVAGLANAFGQRPGTARAEASAASLSVYAPSRIRSGLYFEARFHIVAHRELKNAILLLNNGWAEGITINTIEPSPLGEASRNGSIAFQLGHIPAG
jgi:hypothetical protein